MTLAPPAADLADQAEPVEPDPATADEALYDDYSDRVLMWGRSMRKALARARTWVAENAPR